MPSNEERERAALEVVEQPWDLFIRDWRLKRGEHLTILGPTGTGKTTLGLQLLGKSRHVAMLATKPRDPFYGELQRRGWTRVSRWPRSYEEDSRGRVRLLVHIPTATPQQVPASRRIAQEMCERISTHGDMTLFIDELMFASDPRWLALGPHLELGWQQWRTAKNSIVAAAQRSSHVSLLAYDQVTHIFTAVENDLRNADRIGEMAGLDRWAVRDAVRGLAPFEWLHIETRAGGARRLETLRPPKLI